jgi:hypothetical protein
VASRHDRSVGAILDRSKEEEEKEEEGERVLRRITLRASNQLCMMLGRNRVDMQIDGGLEMWQFCYIWLIRTELWIYRRLPEVLVYRTCFVLSNFNPKQVCQNSLAPVLLLALI